MPPFRADLHVLTGAYAVNAVDDEVELARFERHLRRCQQCAGEVHDLTEATTRLAFAAAMTPPRGMRDRVLAAITRTRQLPPQVDRRSAADRRPGRVVWFAGAVATAGVAAAVTLTFALVHTKSQLDRATSQLNRTTSQLNRARSQLDRATIELDRARSQAVALAAVLAAPDARARTAPIAVGGTATAVYSLRLHSVIVTSASLPPPPPGKVYELWLIGPPRVRPAGFLPASGRRTPVGRSASVLVTGLRRGDELGMTIEPAAGTRAPTTTPILVIALPA